MTVPLTPCETAAWLRGEQRLRALRGRLFGSRLFIDPVWNVLIDLRAAQIEGTRISVSSAVIASGIPATTGLTKLRHLAELGLIERYSNGCDGRRTHVRPTPATSALLDRFVGIAIGVRAESAPPPPIDAAAAIGAIRDILTMVRA